VPPVGIDRLVPASDHDAVPRRLLLIADSLGGGLGGAVAAHGRWFGERGWDVVVAAPATPGWPDALAGAAAFEPVAIPGTGRRVDAMRDAARSVRKLAGATRPDVVHAHGMRALAVGRLAGLRPYVTLHGSGRATDDPVAYDVVRRLVRRAVPLLARGAYSATPQFGGGWRFLPHASPRLAQLHALPAPDGSGPTLVAWIARLDADKRPELFVRAIASAARRVDVRGAIAGSGTAKASLEQLIAELGAPVDLLGDVDPGPLLARSSVVAVFGTNEALTFALQEAMWVGRPVVTTDHAGSRWLVGDTGELAADVAGAASAFVRLADRAHAADLGRRAAERIRRQLTPDAPWPQLADIYAADT